MIVPRTRVGSPDLGSSALIMRQAKLGRRSSRPKTPVAFVWQTMIPTWGHSNRRWQEAIRQAGIVHDLSAPRIKMIQGVMAVIEGKGVMESVGSF